MIAKIPYIKNIFFISFCTFKKGDRFVRASSTLTAHQISPRSVALHNKATVDCLNSKHSYHQLSDSASKSAAGECVMRADTTCSLVIVCLCVKAPGRSNGTLVRTSVKVCCDSWVAHKAAAKSSFMGWQKHDKSCSGVELMSLKVSEHPPGQASRGLTVYAYTCMLADKLSCIISLPVFGHKHWRHHDKAENQQTHTPAADCPSQCFWLQGCWCSVLHISILITDPSAWPAEAGQLCVSLCVCNQLQFITLGNDT